MIQSITDYRLVVRNLLASKPLTDEVRTLIEELLMKACLHGVRLSNNNLTQEEVIKQLEKLL